jgi:hypothetical protein
MSCAKTLGDCNMSFAFGVFDEQILWKYNLGTDKKQKPEDVDYFSTATLKDFSMFLFDIEGTAQLFQPHQFSPYQKFNKKRNHFESEILDSEAIMVVKSIPKNEIDDVKIDLDKQIDD